MNKKKLHPNMHIIATICSLIYGSKCFIDGCTEDIEMPDARFYREQIMPPQKILEAMLIILVVGFKPMAKLYYFERNKHKPTL